MLIKEKILSNAEKNFPDNFKISLDNKKSKLETYLKIPEALKQTQLIAVDKIAAALMAGAILREPPYQFSHVPLATIWKRRKKLFKST